MFLLFADFLLFPKKPPSSAVSQQHYLHSARSLLLLLGLGVHSKNMLPRSPDVVMIEAFDTLVPKSVHRANICDHSTLDRLSLQLLEVGDPTGADIARMLRRLEETYSVGHHYRVLCPSVGRFVVVAKERGNFFRAQIEEVR
jgi:hypothetical protein